MGILGSEYQWAHVEWCQPRIPWSQLKRKGLRGVVGHPLPTKRGNHKWYGLYQGSYGVPGHQQSLFIPGTSTSAGHNRSSTSSSHEVVINIPLFIPGHWRFLVYTREKRAIHTSGRGVGSASLAKHSRGAIPGPFACVAPGRARSTPVGRFWAVSFLQLSRLWDVHNGRRPFRTTQGSSFR